MLTIQIENIMTNRASWIIAEEYQNKLNLQNQYTANGALVGWFPHFSDFYHAHYKAPFPTSNVGDIRATPSPNAPPGIYISIRVEKVIAEYRCMKRGNLLREGEWCYLLKPEDEDSVIYFFYDSFPHCENLFGFFERALLDPIFEGRKIQMRFRTFDPSVKRLLPNAFVLHQWESVSIQFKIVAGHPTEISLYDIDFGNACYLRKCYYFLMPAIRAQYPYKPDFQIAKEIYHVSNKEQESVTVRLRVFQPGKSLKQIAPTFRYDLQDFVVDRLQQRMVLPKYWHMACSYMQTNGIHMTFSGPVVRDAVKVIRAVVETGLHNFSVRDHFDDELVALAEKIRANNTHLPGYPKINLDQKYFDFVAVNPPVITYAVGKEKVKYRVQATRHNRSYFSYHVPWFTTISSFFWAGSNATWKKIHQRVYNYTRPFLQVAERDWHEDMFPPYVILWTLQWLPDVWHASEMQIINLITAMRNSCTAVIRARSVHQVRKLQRTAKLTASIRIRKSIIAETASTNDVD